MSTTDYVLGHSDLEVERLKVQAAAIAGVSRRLVRESGIAPGMSVLDIGCGAGDTALLLAEAVGPSGRVVAIDSNARAIQITRTRVEAAGHSNVEALVVADDSIPRFDTPFDGAFGRYVLLHQRDPAGMIRAAATVVRTGGIIAFHEVANHAPNVFQAFPRVDLFDRVTAAVTAAIGATFASPAVAGQLVACFLKAGLPTPHLICECVIGDARSIVGRWMALGYCSLLPTIKRLGLEPPGVGDPETLVARLEAELAAVNAQVVSKPQICGWTAKDLSA